MPNRCNICQCILDQLDEPDTKDCGGDCLRCMAEVAEDPDCQRQRRKLMKAEEIRKIVRLLRRMKTRTPDGLGAYLGDGMPHQPRVDIRSQDLVSLLEELLFLRNTQGNHMTSCKQSVLSFLNPEAPDVNDPPSLVRSIARYNEHLESLKIIEADIRLARQGNTSDRIGMRKFMEEFRVLLNKLTLAVLTETRIACRGGTAGSDSVDAEAQLILHVQTFLTKVNDAVQES